MKTILWLQSFILYVIYYEEIIYSQIIEKNYIEIDFLMPSHRGLLLIPTEIGTPSQLINLIIDINAEYTSIIKDIFNPILSSSFNQINEDDFTETFIINSIIFKQYNFKLEDDNNSIKTNLLSLRRETNKTSYSFLKKTSELLKVNHIEYSLSFKDVHHGTLTIGQQEKKEYIENKQYNCSLMEIHNSNKWGCNITQVFIGEMGFMQEIDLVTKEQYYFIQNKENKIIHIKRFAQFETTYNRIYVDTDFMNYLKGNYFQLYPRVNKNKPIAKSVCVFEEDDLSTKVICPKEDAIRLKQINFVFDSHLDLYLTFKELFDCSDKVDTCNFLIEVNKDITTTNWIMGIPLLKMFETHFVEGDAIYFSGNNNKEIVRISTPNLLKPYMNNATIIAFIIIGIVVTLLMGFGIIYMFRYKNKQRQRITHEIYQLYKQ